MVTIKHDSDCNDGCKYCNKEFTAGETLDLQPVDCYMWATEPEVEDAINSGDLIVLSSLGVPLSPSLGLSRLRTSSNWY